MNGWMDGWMDGNSNLVIFFLGSLLTTKQVISVIALKNSIEEWKSINKK
jgi:hypothetical protein